MAPPLPPPLLFWRLSPPPMPPLLLRVDARGPRRSLRDLEDVGAVPPLPPLFGVSNAGRDDEVFLGLVEDDDEDDVTLIGERGRPPFRWYMEARVSSVTSKKSGICLRKLEPRLAAVFCGELGRGLVAALFTTRFELPNHRRVLRSSSTHKNGVRKVFFYVALSLACNWSLCWGAVRIFGF